jgi:two-component system response regulator DesR
MRPTAELLKIALECEVHGLLSTGLPREEAATALLRICAGERILRFNADSGLSSKPLRFSARERHVLRELAEGADTARIAAALHTSVSAVKGNLSRLFHKTGARNRRELAQFSRFVMSESEPGMDATARSSLDALWMLDSL